ncbi:hypothetical protein ABZW30_13205 [Kitasatospora sp. NPDC004669]|uniref:hypothetical protein n=1 Tax=Kitasatospora sp. NPDC004669 TaxID=3154555 RepID=UPI0033BF941E
MATTVLTRPALCPTPSPGQRQHAASAIRAIGQLAPRPSRARYACNTCSVAWSGPEADCWCCGMPAIHARNDASLLHHLLLAPVTPRKAGPR